VNTVEPRVGPARRDALTGYAALADWAGLPHLRAAAGTDPAGAARAFRAAIRLREALFTLFAALAGGQPPDPAAVDVLRRRYAAACRASTWHVTGSDLSWHWPDDDLHQIGHRIAVEAVRLAESTVRIGQCPPAHGGCGWLFADRTRNGSRRWCSMADCGNTVKARRLTAKRKAARS
jgi:predicted RNA-binding Zn ribbon-like protein